MTKGSLSHHVREGTQAVDSKASMTMGLLKNGIRKG